MKYKDFISIDASLHNIEMECSKTMNKNDMKTIRDSVFLIRSACSRNVNTEY